MHDRPMKSRAQLEPFGMVFFEKSSTEKIDGAIVNIVDILFAISTETREIDFKTTLVIDLRKGSTLKDPDHGD